MKWLEIIELRSVRNADALEGLSRAEFGGTAGFSGQTASGPEPIARRLYRHGFIETDYSVHLDYEADRIPAAGTPFSLRLAAALAEYGLVSHSVWCSIVPGAKPNR